MSLFARLNQARSGRFALCPSARGRWLPGVSDLRTANFWRTPLPAIVLALLWVLPACTTLQGDFEMAPGFFIPPLLAQRHGQTESATRRGRATLVGIDQLQEVSFGGA